LLGHHVTTAESGEHALSLLTEQASPDVVILDMTMPGLGGVGTLPLLKGKLPLVPVLLSTGQHDQAVTDLAASFPSVHILPKPYSIEALRSKLQMAVSRGG